MRFAQQRRALFRHLNFRKWSEPLVFLTFWLRNVLRATTACTFSTSQLPKVVRRWGVLYILTWKCASRHNGVQLFISHLPRWLRTRCFSEPTFRPSRAPNHLKNTVFRDFPTFSHICIFFLLTLSLLSASALLCFSSVHIVGSLTSKLPSIMSCFLRRFHCSHATGGLARDLSMSTISEARMVPWWPLDGGSVRNMVPEPVLGSKSSWQGEHQTRPKHNQKSLKESKRHN